MGMGAGMLSSGTTLVIWGVYSTTGRPRAFTLKVWTFCGPTAPLGMGAGMLRLTLGFTAATPATAPVYRVGAIAYPTNTCGAGAARADVTKVNTSRGFILVR